ncbi:anthranilate synthase family protein [Homoserinibacter sp. YIM 151385]|uniref:anthranilate synthase family protein n=1 Tax=Homoserinibacter sp. YIM 151385 TaxID=2985506 RepID=UPI0022F144CD|nr:chorismate-binding protein [Homoserinibacter sp. YIM 151385]WBU37382.1 chorismate-binding protein [Homoserinibacter sp. YIM 151385]
MTALLASLLHDDALPFAVLHRRGAPEVDVLVGDVVDVERLADIPLEGSTVLALVPFRQVRERGFDAHDDEAPLRCLVVRERELVPLAEALALLPAEPVAIEAAGFDIPDATYGATVRQVIEEEIGRGEGANFVIRRDFVSSTRAAPGEAVLSWMRALLEHEQGAYWTFAIRTPGLAAAGATPERHVSVDDGTARMNPISGTFRHGATAPTGEALLEFLADVKESEELFMVVDEEMKMMSAVCPDGGRILGPYLKQMSRLTHTEYVLEGRTDLDVREVLRLTMFAPTVTGSPMGNACAVIARHETAPRGYYSGVLALFEPGASPGAEGYSLDAPILIRTAYLDDAGRVTVPVGATLVRHSTPEGEVAETHAKAAGVLMAIGAVERPAAAPAPVLYEEPGVAEALASRNDRLAAFWLRPQSPPAPSELTGLSAIVVDHEDQFTTMLAHQLRHLGLDARVVHWDAVPEGASADLVVFGPGPGDPRRLQDPRMATLHRRLGERLDAGLPTLAVCLSHQVLAMREGLEIEPLLAPRQGVRLEVDVFGERPAIGFYNTFAARVEPGPDAAAGTRTRHGLEVSADAATGVVHALRGPKVASVQGHLESVLSSDGLATLERLVRHAVA